MTVLFVNEPEAVALSVRSRGDADALLDLVPAPVDTTAAGDVYAGVFITTYAAGLGIATAMDRATRVTAHQVAD